MNGQEIIEMLREAAGSDMPDPVHGVLTLHTNDIDALIKLVAAKEREACAKLCETRLGPTATDFYGNVYAQAIRARA